MSEIAQVLTERVRKTEHGFGDIKATAQEVVSGSSRGTSISIAGELFSREEHQARMLAAFILGMVAPQSEQCLRFLRERVSKDPDWRVQEILAQAFNIYCANAGYESTLPVIREWLNDKNPNVRRAVTEGLRIWTSRPYFQTHPEIAVNLLVALKDDESEYVRKSAGNALRDISRKHPDLVRCELETWNLSDKRIAQTYRLANRFLSPNEPTTKEVYMADKNGIEIDF